MDKVLILFCGLLAASQAGVLNPLSSRVVNGEKAKLGEIPYQVSLQHASGAHFCGGSIINQHWVITAAHCVLGSQASDVFVGVGTTLYKVPSQKLAVEEIVVHTGYDSSDSYRHDIALLKVKGAFVYNELVKPVPMPKQDQHTETHSVATVSGWGLLGYHEWEVPDDLMKANIFIADPAYCSEVVKEGRLNVYDTQICANDPTQRRGSCNGDSGGPLTVDGQLVGLVSWTIKDGDCASTKYPTVYTRVPKYIDWINEHVTES